MNKEYKRVIMYSKLGLLCIPKINFKTRLWKWKLIWIFYEVKNMKINRSFARCGRKIISVALCLVMMFTTFFIFEPSVLKITASAAAWSGSTSATSGTDYTISASTMHIKTPNGLAWFMNNLGTYASYTVYPVSYTHLRAHET